MRANNFVIYSNYLTTNDSNNAIANDVGIQINQDGYLNLPHDTSIYGDINASKNLTLDGVATFKQTMRIEPSTINTAAGINIFGGTGLSETWFVGRGALNVGTNNFVIGSSYLPVINNGITQQRVGFQINADAQAYFPGRVNALGGAEIKGDFYAVNNAYITTLQVNANSYLNGDVYFKPRRRPLWAFDWPEQGTRNRITR
jgi:hypothetical protein